MVHQDGGTSLVNRNATEKVISAVGVPSHALLGACAYSSTGSNMRL